MMSSRGGGTLLANVNANEYIANDIDKNVISLVKLLYQNDANKIIEDIDKTTKKYNLDFDKDSRKKRINISSYNELKSTYNQINNKNTYEANIILLILVIFGFNSQIRFNSKNEFNVPSGKQGFNKNRRNVFIDFSNKIKKNKILFQNKDFNFINKLLDKKEINQDDFFYFDPPYSITNATYNIYWTNENDLELFNLLDSLNKCGIKWALSNVFEANGKKNIALIKWSQKYKIKYLSKDYKNSNYQRKNLDKDVEVLIINYEI